MSHITIPEGYQSLLGLYDTQKAIGLIKTIFQEKLCMTNRGAVTRLRCSAMQSFS